MFNTCLLTISVVVFIIVKNNRFLEVFAVVCVWQNISVDKSYVMHVQVPHAAINGQSRKHAGKLAKNAGSTIGSDEGLDTIKAGYMTTSDKRIGAGSGETDVNTMQKVDVDGQSGQAAAGVITDALSKTSNPSTDALTEVKKKSRKGRRQRASNKKLTGEKASAAAPVKNTSSTDMQEAAPAFTNTGSDIKRGKKKDRATLTSTPLQHNPPAETAGMKPIAQTDSCPPVAAAVELLMAHNCCFPALLHVKALNAMSCSLHAHVDAFTLMMTI